MSFKDDTIKLINKQDKENYKSWILTQDDDINITYDDWNQAINSLFIENKEFIEGLSLIGKK